MQCPTSQREQKLELLKCFGPQRRVLGPQRTHINLKSLDYRANIGLEILGQGQKAAMGWASHGSFFSTRRASTGPSYERLGSGPLQPYANQ
jgi:hypothetical protein